MFMFRARAAPFTTFKTVSGAGDNPHGSRRSRAIMESPAPSPSLAQARDSTSLTEAYMRSCLLGACPHEQVCLPLGASFKLTKHVLGQVCRDLLHTCAQTGGAMMHTMAIPPLQLMFSGCPLAKRHPGSSAAQKVSKTIFPYSYLRTSIYTYIYSTNTYTCT